MAVILPNAQLTVRRRAHQFGRDEHGTPVANTSWGPEEGPSAGAVVEPDDLTPAQAPYRLRVDPAHWPLRADDEITDDQGRKFIVRTARKVEVPVDDAVDFIRVTADLDPPQVP
jgi:hypothetical protein